MKCLLGKNVKYVFVVFNACPEGWNIPSVLRIFWKRRDAERERKLIVGGDPVGMQYVEVQRWTVE